DGPFDCPAADAVRRADPTWRRTVRIRAPPGSSVRTDVAWVSASRESPDGWPRCAWGGETAECWGSAVGTQGALVVTDGGREWWSLVNARAPVADFQQSAWARLILVNDAVEYGRLSATIARPMTSAERRMSLRLDTALVVGAHAVSVAGAAIWVHGD